MPWGRRARRPHCRSTKNPPRRPAQPSHDHRVAAKSCRQRSEGDVAEITDLSGVQWSVRRRRWYDMSSGGIDGNSLGDNPLLGLLLLPFFLVAIWPVWFIAHWLGVRWVIVIERDGKAVGKEEV